MARNPRPRRKGVPKATRTTLLDEQGAGIPIWLPPVLYGALTIFLFREFIFSQEMLYGSDTVALGYMAREFYANAVKGVGGFPFWNPIILGGTPFIESLAGGDSLYPPSAILLMLMAPHRALGWKLVLHVFLAGVFMYGWIRQLGLSRAAALLAGLAYGLAPFMVTLVHGGQDGKIFLIALTPLLFWVTEVFLARANLTSFASLAIVIGAIILTTHFQMAYFLFGSVGVYVLFRVTQMWRGEVDTDDLPRRKRVAVGRFGGFSCAALLGAGIAAVQLLPAASYVVDYSRRTSTTNQATEQEAIAYSSSWSLHPEEIVGLAVPEFVGVTTANAEWARDTYWGRNGFKANHEYVGLVVILLAAISFFGGIRRSLRILLTVLGSVALLFALGNHTPVWRILYELVPGISLFRAPSLSIFLFGFSTVTLMAFGIERLLYLEKNESKAQWLGPERFLWIATGIFLLGFLLAASGTITGLWSEFVYQEIPPQSSQILSRAEPFIVRGFLIATVLASITAGVVWGLRTTRITPVKAIVVLAVLLTVDFIRVDSAFIETSNYEDFRTADPNIDVLLERQRTEDPFRVFSLHGLNGQDVRPGMFGLELTGGHHPNDLGRYRELIGMAGSGLPVNLLNSSNILRVLNTRYILWPDQLGAPADQGLPSEIVDNLQRVSQTTIQGSAYESVYMFPDLPRARLVTEAVVLQDDQAVPFMLSQSFDPVRQVVLADPPPFELSGGSAEGSIEWLERGNNEMRLQVSTDRPALLVLADNWFPAWKAYVEGRATPILRANHTLRAVPIPEGDHTVEIRYESAQLTWSFRLTIVSLTLVAVLVGLDRILSVRRERVKFE